MKSNSNNKKSNKSVSGFFNKLNLQKRSKLCPLASCNARDINHRNIELIKTFLSPGGRILSKNFTGLCSKHQRKIRQVVKRARFLSLIKYCDRHR